MGKRASGGTAPDVPPPAKAAKGKKGDAPGPVKQAVETPAGESFNSGHLSTIADIIKMIREQDIFEDIDAAPPLDDNNGGREAAFDVKHFRSAMKAEKGEYKCAGTQYCMT